MNSLQIGICGIISVIDVGALKSHVLAIMLIFLLEESIPVNLFKSV